MAMPAAQPTVCAATSMFDGIRPLTKTWRNSAVRLAARLMPRIATAEPMTLDHRWDRSTSRVPARVKPTGMKSSAFASRSDREKRRGGVESRTRVNVCHALSKGTGRKSKGRRLP